MTPNDTVVAQALFFSVTFLKTMLLGDGWMCVSVQYLQLVPSILLRQVSSFVSIGLLDP